jgi:hypothetical protein
LLLCRRGEEGNFEVDELLEVVEVGDIEGADEADDLLESIVRSRAAASVEVHLGVRRHRIVDNELELLDVDLTRGDIGDNEGLELPAL